MTTLNSKNNTQELKHSYICIFPLFSIMSENSLIAFLIHYFVSFSTYVYFPITYGKNFLYILLFRSKFYTFFSQHWGVRVSGSLDWTFMYFFLFFFFYIYFFNDICISTQFSTQLVTCSTFSSSILAHCFIIQQNKKTLPILFQFRMFGPPFFNTKHDPYRQLLEIHIPSGTIAIENCTLDAYQWTQKH